MNCGLQPSPSPRRTWHIAALSALKTHPESWIKKGVVEDEG
jgi:hypothetical protein